MFWFEGIHSNNPDNIMFADIKTEFTQFGPDLALVEGGRDENIKQNEEEAILLGESSYVAFLAHEDSIDCESTEPPDSYMGQELISKYEINDILATLTFLQIKQWQRESKERTIDFNDMIVGWIKANSERMFQDLKIEINLAYIQDILEPFAGYRVDDSNWLDVPADKIIDDDNIINAIWRDRSVIRNKYLVELIQEKMTLYNKIFIMMGFDHANAIMTDLENIFEKSDT